MAKKATKAQCDATMKALRAKRRAKVRDQYREYAESKGGKPWMSFGMFAARLDRFRREGW